MELDKQVAEEKLAATERSLHRQKNLEDKATVKRRKAEDLLNEAKKFVTGRSSDAMASADAASKRAADEAEQIHQKMKRLAKEMATIELGLTSLNSRANRTESDLDHAKDVVAKRKGVVAKTGEQAQLATKSADYKQRRLKGAEKNSADKAKDVLRQAGDVHDKSYEANVL